MECSCQNKTESLQDRGTSTVIPFIHKDNAKNMARHVQHAEKSASSKRSAEATKAKSCTVLTHKNWDNVNINSVKINSTTFNSKCSVITANLNTSSSQAASVVPYLVDSGNHGNIIP